MKKIFILSFILSFVISLSNYAFSQDDDYYGNYEEQAKIKQLFLDVGYGANGVGAGLGFRYSFFGVGLNLSGFAKDIPNYTRLNYNQQQNKLKFDKEEKYPTIILSLDGYLFYDIDDYFSLFGNIGLYSEADTVLAREIKNNNTSGDLYWIRNESTWGPSFGGGLQYLLEEYIGFGIGYHNKKGFFAQVNYFWF